MHIQLVIAEKKLNLITIDDFIEIEGLIVSYFKNIEKINPYQNLTSDFLKHKTLELLEFLLISHLINKKEEFKTILTVGSKDINILDLNIKKLFYPIFLKVNNENILNLFAFYFFFKGKENKSEEIIDVELEIDEKKKLTLKVKKNRWENINKNNKLNESFNLLKNLFKMSHIPIEEKLEIFPNEDMESNDQNIIKEKITNALSCFKPDNYSFEDLKAIYDEFQFKEKTFTIDFAKILV